MGKAHTIAIVLFVASLLLLACTAAPQAPVPAPIPTPAPTSLPTPTPEPAPKPATPNLERQQGEEYYIDGERYILPTFEELERERDGLARNYPKTVNGVSEHGPWAHHLINNSLPELRDLGVNTIPVKLSHNYDHRTNELVLKSVRFDNQRSFVGEKVEREYIDRVVKAKKPVLPSTYDLNTLVRMPGLR